MKINEGKFDRSIRIIAGVALIGLAISGQIGMWGYLGVIPLLTGAVGMCPLYSIFGINTCPVTR
ncbi:MAG: YgaP family membrane protein [Burkholderiaceae bacterium]